MKILPFILKLYLLTSWATAPAAPERLPAVCFLTCDALSAFINSRLQGRFLVWVLKWAMASAEMWSAGTVSCFATSGSSALSQPELRHRQLYRGVWRTINNLIIPHITFMATRELTWWINALLRVWERSLMAHYERQLGKHLVKRRAPIPRLLPYIGRRLQAVHGILTSCLLCLRTSPHFSCLDFFAVDRVEHGSPTPQTAATQLDPWRQQIHNMHLLVRRHRSFWPAAILNCKNPFGCLSRNFAIFKFLKILWDGQRTYLWPFYVKYGNFPIFPQNWGGGDFCWSVQCKSTITAKILLNFDLG